MIAPSRKALIAALILCAPLVTVKLHAADSAKTLIDFGSSRTVRDDYGNLNLVNVYDYAWNDWEKSGTVPLRGKGTLIRAKSGRGNLGQENTRVRFGASPALMFEYVVGAGNQAKAINFKLQDGDGTEAQWTIPLEGRPKQQLSTLRLDLVKPDSVKGGKKPGLDAKGIQKWEVVGDWQDNPTEVLLVKITTAP